MARRDTQITMYKTGRIDPTYQNIWAFASESERNVFLSRKQPRIFSNCKRWKFGNPIIVDIPFEDSYAYDYIVIKNNASDANKTRTYYCFITNRAYINDKTSIFYVDIDIVQTWYFSIGADGGKIPFWAINGFIAKSTSNLLPPRGTPTDFPSIETTCMSFDFAALGYSIVIYSSVDLRDLSSVKYTSSIIDGQYTASPPYIMPANVSAVSELINTLNTLGLTDAISSIYLIPNDYINLTALTGVVIGSDSNLYLNKRITINKPESCGGYVPVNKVLLGYDYTYFTINNGQGEVLRYNFEDFNGAPIFESRLSLSSGSPVILMYPTNYISFDSDEYRQRAQKITFAPSCTYLNDNYKIWLAQSQNSRAAAINQSAEAINQAQYARSQSFAYNYGHEIRNLEETARPVVSSTLYKLGRFANTLTGSTNKQKEGFGGGMSRGGGAGLNLNTGTYNIQNVAGASGHFENDAMALYDLGVAYFNKQIGVETAYQYDFAVKNAQLAQNALLAGYRDKASVPASAVGSNAYGDMCVLQQYGFMVAVYTPTQEYAEWIDKTLSAGGHTTNIYDAIRKYHTVFDFYQVLSPRIQADTNVRPDFARAHLIALLINGVYLWYYNQNDISPYIGTPYNLNNPGV